MKNTLFLEKDEQVLFSRLPESLRDGWTVESETGKAYEDGQVLKINASIARFDSYPQLKELTKEAARTGKLDPALIKKIPESVLPELFFTIGATGVKALIVSLLPLAKTDEDVMGIAGLTTIRHDILQTNSAISYT